MIFLATPYAIIGGLILIREPVVLLWKGVSRPRGLVVGQVARAIMIKTDQQDVWVRACLFLTFGILLGAPTIGGIVFVGKMYKESGACVSI